MSYTVFSKKRNPVGVSGSENAGFGSLIVRLAALESWNVLAGSHLKKLSRLKVINSYWQALVLTIKQVSVLPQSLSITARARTQNTI